jgi:hypothetical protein
LFKMADGLAAALVPAADLPIAAVNAGVDLVCAHPERFAADISTLEWLARNLKAEIDRHRAGSTGPQEARFLRPWTACEPGHEGDGG